MISPQGFSHMRF